MRFDQSLLKPCFAFACDDDLAAGINDRLGVFENEIDALLVDETSDKGEQWPARKCKPELAPDLIGVFRSIIPITSTKRLA